MKNNIVFTFLFLTICCFTFSCGDDKDEPGGGTTGGANNNKITIAPVTKFEGDEPTTFDFKVRLEETSDKVVTIDFETKDASAIAGEDYVAQSGTISFDGTTVQTISVEIIPDTLKEGDEEFQVILKNPTNALLDVSEATGIIRNDDTFLPGGNDGYITPDAYAGMTLVWQDEFGGTTLDETSWTSETGNNGWGNNELQNYTSRPENAYLSDGKLIIEARQESFGGSNYTSARLITAGKREFAFGRVDVRAKLPEGQGIWPAIWMLGADIFTEGWPSCGEIDIMELVGHEANKIHGTAHWGPQGSPSINRGNAFTLSGENYSKEFHVFSVIWENNKIRWYVDDNLFFTLEDSDVGSLYPFNDEFFFILNIAVGGNWPGNPDATTVFPQRMFVDYIRMFQ